MAKPKKKRVKKEQRLSTVASSVVSSTSGITLERHASSAVQSKLGSAISSVASSSENDKPTNKGDTAMTELDTGEFLMKSATRLNLEIVIALSALLFLFVGTGYDLKYAMEMQRLYEPFPLIFRNLTARIPISDQERFEPEGMEAGSADRLEEAQMNRKNSEGLVPQVFAYNLLTAFNFVFNAAKTWVILATIESETEKALGSHSSVGLSLLSLCSTGMFFYQIGMCHWISKNNLESIEATKDTFNRTMFYYPLNYTEKLEIDRIQMEYQCCGAEGFRDYFKVPVSGRVDDPANDMQKRILKYNFSVLYEGIEFRLTHDVPWSCCDSSKLAICRLYNVDNSLNFYHHGNQGNASDIPDAYYDTGCVTKIQQVLQHEAFHIEQILIVRIVLEAVTGILLKLVYTSYVSQFELQHEPSIAALPTLLIVVYLASLITFYFLSIKFANLSKFGLGFVDSKISDSVKKELEDMINNSTTPKIRITPK